MLAEFMAETGRAVLKGVPPDGRDYWAARFWDRDSAERHSILADEFLLQKDTIAGYLSTYGAEAERALEFACGTGEFTRLVAERTKVREITALDISAQGLELARERVKHDALQLLLGDFWKDNGLKPADLVLCIDAIHHLGDVRQVLRRLKTFVEPGGTFVGNVWIADHFHEFQRKRYGALEHFGRTALFLSTALLIRATGGRVRTGSYRTQLLRSAEVEKILAEEFSEVLDVKVERYFMGFVCRP
ncbi:MULTISPECIES: class I SAM-dependent methyltransferase [unclassified Nonomuraea]|uniref:class I SAM-dependent methyltransferase n=1 Tax=unclassified Nonomuraea TaxID=2593643 RepID=UPI0033E42D4E